MAPGVLQTASESPAVSVPTTSPRRVSRRDIDLGLSPAAPTSSPSPNSLPYQASPDHPDLMEENVMSDDGEEDDEISSGADAPQVSVRTSAIHPWVLPLATQFACMYGQCSVSF